MSAPVPPCKRGDDPCPVPSRRTLGYCTARLLLDRDLFTLEECAAKCQALRVDSEQATLFAEGWREIPIEPEGGPA